MTRRTREKNKKGLKMRDSPGMQQAVAAKACESMGLRLGGIMIDTEVQQTEEEKRETDGECRRAVAAWEAWRRGLHDTYWLFKMKAERAVERLKSAITDMENGLAVAVKVDALVGDDVPFALINGRCKEFIGCEEGERGDDERLLLAWALRRRDRATGCEDVQVSNDTGRWQVDCFRDWLREYNREFKITMRWYRVMVIEGSRWGMDVCGCMGVTVFEGIQREESHHVQRMRRQCTGRMVLRRLTQLAWLAVACGLWTETTEVRSEECRSDAGDNNGDAGCDANSNNNENTDKVGAAGGNYESLCIGDVEATVDKAKREDAGMSREMGIENLNDGGDNNGDASCGDDDNNNNENTGKVGTAAHVEATWGYTTAI